MATATQSPQLNEQHYAELAEATERAKKLRKVIRVAAFNGWTSAIFAVICLPFAFSDLTSAVMCTGLGIVAYNEFRGRKWMQQFDLRGPTLLGWNQTGFMLLLVGYSIWKACDVMFGSGIGDTMGSQSPHLQQAMAEMKPMLTMAMAGVYVGLAFLCFLFQGMNAIYYFTRAGLLKKYLAETPDWIVEVQRSTVTN